MAPLMLVLLFAATTSGILFGRPERPECITSCEGLESGDYPSCYSCQHYATCSNGHLYDRRACPDDLFWDQTTQSCQRGHRNCPKGVPITPPKPSLLSLLGKKSHHKQAPSCVSSCKNMPDGHYTSCYGCTFYVSCSGGVLYQRRCPAGLEWQGSRGWCTYDSPECMEDPDTRALSTRKRPPFCVASCHNVNDGHYYSCQGCTFYVSCSGGVFYERRCPAGLRWDNRNVMCTYNPPDCSKDSDTRAVHDTPSWCVSSCVGMRDGDYHSCYGCQFYATCSNGNLHDKRKCPSGTVWHGLAKECLYFSSTCPIDELRAVKREANCISSCEGQANGNHQYCDSCSQFLMCSNELTYVFNCSVGTFWDDTDKACLVESTTCSVTPGPTTTPPPEQPDTQPPNTDAPPPENTEAPAPEATEAPAPEATEAPAPEATEAPAELRAGKRDEICVSSCEGLANGDYQDCDSCSNYVTCWDNEMHVRPCPNGLFWDDNVKRCEPTSTTCFEICVSSCEGRANGDYQDCDSCDHYVTCWDSLMYVRPCPKDLFWDDNFKRCQAISTTCFEKRKEPELRADKRDESCVSSCVDLADGDYQHCDSCSLFVHCSNKQMYERSCPPGLVFDDGSKRCEFASTTCSCVSSCVDRDDGQYRHCDSCSLFVHCSNKQMYERSCPPGLVWDDGSKMCEFASTTCSCVSSCVDLDDGHYQHCDTCSLYVECSNRQMFERACPPGLVWDDSSKRCEVISKTCLETSKIDELRAGKRGANCISSCEGQANGNHQYCESCSQFLMCSNELTYVFNCSVGTFWDDTDKACLGESTTCSVTPGPTTTPPPEQPDTQPPNTDAPPPENTEAPAPEATEAPAPEATEAPEVRGHSGKEGATVCAPSCSRRPDGNYQSCVRCNGYVACGGGLFYEQMCAEGTVWDDSLKTCHYTSTTCNY